LGIYNAYYFDLTLSVALGSSATSALSEINPVQVAKIVIEKHFSSTYGIAKLCGGT
jgi:hypothetical protein